MQPCNSMLHVKTATAHKYAVANCYVAATVAVHAACAILAALEIRYLVKPVNAAVKLRTHEANTIDSSS